jgi:hypothetical protein
MSTLLGFASAWLGHGSAGRDDPMVVIGSYRTHVELRKKPRRPFKYNAKVIAGKGKLLLACLVVGV